MKIKNFFIASLFAIAFTFAACGPSSTNRDDQGRNDQLQEENYGTDQSTGDIEREDEMGRQDNMENEDQMGTSQDTTDTSSFQQNNQF